MFCNQCGAQIPDGSRFCLQCGAKLPEMPAPAPEKPKEEAPTLVLQRTVTKQQLMDGEYLELQDPRLPTTVRVKLSPEMEGEEVFTINPRPGSNFTPFDLCLRVIEPEPQPQPAAQPPIIDCSVTLRQIREHERVALEDPRLPGPINLQLEDWMETKTLFNVSHSERSRPFPPFQVRLHLIPEQREPRAAEPSAAAPRERLVLHRTVTRQQLQNEEIVELEDPSLPRVVRLRLSASYSDGEVLTVAPGEGKADFPPFDLVLHLTTEPKNNAPQGQPQHAPATRQNPDANRVLLRFEGEFRLDREDKMNKALSHFRNVGVIEVYPDRLVVFLGGPGMAASSFGLIGSIIGEGLERKGKEFLTLRPEMVKRKEMKPGVALSMDRYRFFLLDGRVLDICPASKSWDLTPLKQVFGF